MTALPAAAACLVAVGGLAWWLRRRFLIVTVRGASMAPTYADGDRVLIRRTGLQGVRAGDIVVAAGGRPVGAPVVTSSARSPWLVKRAVAVPGDPVPAETLAVLGAAPGQVVPPGRFVAYGDNAGQSADSRQMGYFHAERLLGVVVARFG